MKLAQASAGEREVGGISERCENGPRKLVGAVARRSPPAGAAKAVLSCGSYVDPIVVYLRLRAIRHKRSPNHLFGTLPEEVQEDIRA